MRGLAVPQDPTPIFLLTVLSSIIVRIMKLLPRLTAAVVLCLTIMSLLPLPLQGDAGCRFPEITLSPDYGVPGDIITITGNDFELNSWVDIYFDGIWIEEVFTPAGVFTVDIEVPEIPRGTYRIRAETENDEEEASFNVRPGVSVSPRSGAIGTMITVTGRGFGANETDIEVRRGLYETVDDGISANPDGTWETTFEMPAWTRGEHEIRALGSKTPIIQGVRPAVFEVKPGISIAHASGAVGQSIAISGNGFDANERNIRVVIDRRPVATTPTSITADSTGRWNATFTVPEVPAGEYAVTAEGDRTRRRDIDEVPFEIKPILVLSPAGGHVGTNVTATGHGFASNKQVAIVYDDNEVEMPTTITDDEGSFTVVFAVPPSSSGERTVKAGVIGETNSIADLNSATATFMMESDAPDAPELVSPGDGRRVGFFRRATPTFEWDEVFDLSGVYYSIKVATSPDFEADSIVASATGLTGTSYTPEEPLPNGTYYWTVRAVDGAENESQWSDPQRLRVGRLPMWGFIVIFSFIGLLLALRAYFILVRPKLYE